MLLAQGRSHPPPIFSGFDSSFEKDVSRSLHGFAASFSLSLSYLDTLVLQPFSTSRDELFSCKAGDALSPVKGLRCSPPEVSCPLYEKEGLPVPIKMLSLHSSSFSQSLMKGVCGFLPFRRGCLISLCQLVGAIPFPLVR